jgi:hypothetical protein
MANGSRVAPSIAIGGATGGDEVFRALVLARIIEPTSKLDALRVLAEVGADPVAYRTLKRRLPRYATEQWRAQLAAACATHAALGPASLVLYDLSTLYFETDQPDGFWANQGAGTIVQANLDGTGVTTLVSGQNGPVGVAVDSTHIYWANQGAGTIMQANLNGTGVTTLVSGQNGPFGVTVDSTHIYWTNQGDGTVDEANLNGTGVTTLVSGQNGPAGVAVGTH